jgi:hypothetical protein
MRNVLRKLRQLKTGIFSFLKNNWLFLFLVFSIHGIKTGISEYNLFTIMINSMSFAIIFSSAMSVRTNNIIMNDLREIREAAERAR